MHARILSIASGAILALTTSVFSGAVAHATATAAAPTAKCGGAGWQELDTREMWPTNGGYNHGYMSLYYGNGYNCVIVYKDVAIGVPTYTSAFVCRQNDGFCLKHGGNATNEVWTGALYAPDTCVKWGGGVSDVDGSRVYREIPWDYCD
jgi:hypothetical protein